MAKKLVPPEERKSPVRHYERHLQKHLIGQDRPVREISRALERAFSGLKHPDHPIATLAFFGPTGVGKTYAAELLADAFTKHKVWQCQRFHECGFRITKAEAEQGVNIPAHCPRHRGTVPVEEVILPNIWTIDCGTMSGSMSHAVNDLLGAPAGYVGHGSTPPIFSDGKAPRVVLFDEAEKALLSESWRGGGSEFGNVLLKILEKGRIRNRQGIEVNFTNSVIILTGNLGAAEILQEFEGQSLGFRTIKGRRDISEMTDAEVVEINQRIYQVVKKKAQREIAPEFLNRLDRLVVFLFLTQGNYNQILELELTQVQNRINTNAASKPKFVVTYKPGAKKALVDEAMGERGFGARALTRAIEKRITTPLSELINEEVIRGGDHIEVRVEPRKRGKEDKATLAFFRIDPEESPLLLQDPSREEDDD